MKSATKNETGVTLRLPLNIISNFNDETASFLYELLLINRQVSNRRKAFANIKLSKIQLSKIIESDGFLGKLFGPLLKGF